MKTNTTEMGFTGDLIHTDLQIQREEALALSELLKSNTALRSLCLNYGKSKHTTQ